MSLPIQNRVARLIYTHTHTQPYPVAILVQHLVAQLIYTALSSGSTDPASSGYPVAQLIYVALSSGSNDPASSGSTDLHSTIQWLY